MFSIRFYRIYDIGRDIDLDRLEKSLERTVPTTRTGFLRIKPKSIMVDAPPLILRMDPITVRQQDKKEYKMSAFLRIYGIGAISLSFIYEDNEKEPQELEETALAFAGHEGLSEHFDIYLNQVREILSPLSPNVSIDPDFFEDYTVYVTDSMDTPADPVMILLGEKTPVSQQMREEILKNTLSYSTTDRVIVSWDGSIIYGPDSPNDILDLIEFANVQVFELRYYDRELVRRSEKMYDDIELADRMSRFRRMTRYHEIMTQIMEIHAEISEIIEKSNNLIKVTEDIYYAKVYATALREFRSAQWSESVTKKIELLRDNYSMLSDEVRIHHSYFLEWIIIVLIALEFGLAIWQYAGISSLIF